MKSSKCRKDSRFVETIKVKFFKQKIIFSSLLDGCRTNTPEREHHRDNLFEKEKTKNNFLITSLPVYGCDTRLELFRILVQTAFVDQTIRDKTARAAEVEPKLVSLRMDWVRSLAAFDVCEGLWRILICCRKTCSEPAKWRFIASDNLLNCNRKSLEC